MRGVVYCVLVLAGCCTTLAQDIVGMVKKVKPSVITVVPRNAFGLDEGLGSGFFISKTQVVTNYHVIEGASSVKIRFNDSAEFHAKHIVAQDSANDLAILEIELSADRKVVPLTLKYSDPEQGERIYVVGNPLGLEQSVSDGIVSSVRAVKDIGKRIQFTAAISSGNSGSPLMDAAGNVYGVAQYILQGGQNLNFAIPSERIKALTIGTPIAFTPAMKEYDGIMLNVADAFVVDTNLFGSAPKDLNQKDQNIWRLRNAGLRMRWKEETVNLQIPRLLRAIRRNYDGFDIDKDTLSMTQARATIMESLGYNEEGTSHEPSVAALIEGYKLSLQAVAARMALSGTGSTVAFTSGEIITKSQLWQEFKKDEDYVVYAMCDTTDISDLDLAVFHFEEGKWKPVAADTKDDAYPSVVFTANHSDEYAVIFRVAKRRDKSKGGVFGGMIFTR